MMRCIAIVFYMLGMVISTMAADCFELVNYYTSRPTNYTTRGGDGWMATNASVEPTSSMSFYSSYDYVMLTGGNKNTSPGQLEVDITPTNGVGVLTFLIAKPCKTDRYSGAGVYVYADGELVYSQVVVASSANYKTISVTVNKVCSSLVIYVTNYYTNTTTEHNNRIAFAHFCWTDYINSDPGHGPDDPPTPPTPQERDTVYYSAYVCQDDLPYIWNSIECVRTGNYPYVTTSSEGKDSTTILMLTVSLRPTIKTEQKTIEEGTRLMWHNQYFEAKQAGDTTFVDSVYDSYGCLNSIYYLNLHINPAPPIHIPCDPLMTTRRDTTICEGSAFEWFGQMISQTGSYQHIIPSQLRDTCDSLCVQMHVGYKKSYHIDNSLIVCTQQVPIHWNGQDYSTTGDYTYHGITQEGCDSIVTLHLNVVDALSCETTITCCPKDLPYSWYGQSLSIAGDYQHTLTAASGCDSVVTLHFIVASSAKEVTIDTTLQRGEILEWRELKTDLEGIYYDTIIARTAPFCDSVYFKLTLHYPPKPKDTTIVVPTNDTTHISIRVCAEQLPYQWNGISCDHEDVYTYTTKNQSGGDSIVYMTLTIDTYSATDTIAFCYDNELPFLWRGQELTEAGTATWKTKNKVGCDSIVTLHLYVDPAPVPVEECQPTSSLTEATICQGETFVWHNRKFKNSAEVRDVLTNAAGCDSVCTLRLTVRPLSVSTTSLTVCYDDSVFVHGRWLRHSGIYRDTLRGASATGCDSVCRVIIRETSAPRVIRQAAYIEPSELPYVWRNQTLTTDGEYSDKMRNPITGCDSLHYVFHLHVLNACEPKPILVEQ